MPNYRGQIGVGKPDFRSLKAFVAKGRNGEDRPLENNTRVVDRGDRVAIKLHATDVVTFFEDGDVEFDTGGWNTMTTADRMRYASDFTISSRSGVWYIEHRQRSARIETNLRRKFGLPVTEDDYPEDHSYEYRGNINLGFMKTDRARYSGNGFWQEVADLIGFREARTIKVEFDRELAEKTSYLFFDGIRFTKRGRCVNGMRPDEAQRKVKRDEKLRLQIRDYAKLAVKVLDEGPIPVQNNGDCWYCLMRTANEDAEEIDRNNVYSGLNYGYRFAHLKGKTLGDATDNYEHLREHLREGYVPSAMILNAMDHQPYANVAGKQIHLGIHENEDGEIVMGGVSGERRGYSYSDGRPRRRHSPEAVAKAVYEFMARRLLPGREIRGNFGGMGYHFPEPETNNERTAA